MKTQKWLMAVAIGFFALVGGQSAQADTATVAFPTAGDAYCSATNGCGTIPSGGLGGYQWTTGDYVMSAVFTSTGLGSVNALTGAWHYTDALASGYSETWYVFVNGSLAADILLSGNLSGSETIGISASFAPIAPVSGGYQIELVLQNTIPPGFGSIAWADGGTTTLYGTSSAVPEPSSLLLLCAGLGLVVLRKLI